MMPDGFEILIDSYTAMNHLTIDLSVFLNEKLVVEITMMTEIKTHLILISYIGK
jgi:hypothetical protein